MDKDRKITVILICSTILSTAEVEFFSEIKMKFVEINSNELTRGERERENEQTNPRVRDQVIVKHCEQVSV